MDKIYDSWSLRKYVEKETAAISSGGMDQVFKGI